MAKPVDKKRLEKILKAIKNSGKEGIWIRELARKTNIPVASVHFYLKKHLKDKIKIERAKIGGVKHKQMKVVRLKNEREI